MEITEDEILSWQLQLAKEGTLCPAAQRRLLDEVVDLRWKNSDLETWAVDAP